LNQYKKNILEEDLSQNEKKAQQKKKKMEIEAEKRELTIQSNELKEFNELLNKQLLIERERFLTLSDYLGSTIEDVKSMDSILCEIDKNPNKLLMFSNIDLDSLSYKRRNYKTEAENFNSYFKNCCMMEKEIYDKIVELVNYIIL
jgi:hypothetical protein